MKKAVLALALALLLAGCAAPAGEVLTPPTLAPGGTEPPAASGDPDALARLEAKAKALEAAQDAMKRANAHWRAHGTLDGFAFDDAGLERDALSNMVTFGGAPFPAYALSNNLANVKRTRARIEEIARERESATHDRETTVNGEPCTVVEDAGDMRLRLVFEDKPEEGTRDILKREGFRWSPRAGAWQRQLTDNARRALRRIEG